MDLFTNKKLFISMTGGNINAPESIFFMSLVIVILKVVFIYYGYNAVMPKVIANFRGVSEENVKKTFRPLTFNDSILVYILASGIFSTVG